MFPLGCLEWIKLSNCLSSVDIQYVCLHSQTCMQTSRQTSSYTYDICTHICFSHVPPTALHMVCQSFPSSTLCLLVSLSQTSNPLFFVVIHCTIDICSCIDIGSIRESTITLLFCALIQDRTMLMTCLQLYNCPAYSMWGTWLNKRKRTPCHSYCLTAVFHVSKSAGHRNVNIRNVMNS